MSSGDNIVFALIPISDILDSEADAAEAVGLPVLRFRFIDSLELCSKHPALQKNKKKKAATEQDNCCYAGIHRGFMLSQERYQQLFDEFRTFFGIRLVVDPSQYTDAHYFPNAYPHVAKFSPRAAFTPVSNADTVTRALFADAVKSIKSWTPTVHSVMLKDFVKSAKPRFLNVPVSPPEKGSVELSAAEQAVDLVKVRGPAFNKGVVFKEYVEIAYPKNEWRLWFIKGKLLSENFNSEDTFPFPSRPRRVPRELVEGAEAAASKIKNPFVTIDFAETAATTTGDGERKWVCIEVGDGGVSGPAVEQDLEELWAGLRDGFSCIALHDAAPAATSWIDIHLKVLGSRLVNK